VTGASRGIGAATAGALGGMGARLILGCRDSERGDRVRLEIESRFLGATAEVLRLDLMDLDSVRRFARQVGDAVDRLDVLVNNAGVMPLRPGVTAQGFDECFGVNYLGHFLLTHALLPLLRRSDDARVVHTSSSVHRWAALDLDRVRGEAPVHWARAYARSKLACLLFSNELARRAAADGIASNAIHPGVVATGIVRGFPRWLQPAMKLFASPQRGARSAVHLASSEAVPGVTGKYFAACRERAPRGLGSDRALAEQLWERSVVWCDLDGAG